LEPAVQALLLTLLQVVPQAGQCASRVELGYRVQAGREVLGGRALSRLDLADHVVRDVDQRGQVLLGQPRQGRVARAALAGWLAGCPRADEAVLVASEFATNSVLHSASRHGGAFTLCAEVRQDHVRIEVKDGGGP
jgi:hypothetical protein